MTGEGGSRDQQRFKVALLSIWSLQHALVLLVLCCCWCSAGPPLRNQLSDSPLVALPRITFPGCLLLLRLQVSIQDGTVSFIPPLEGAPAATVVQADIVACKVRRPACVCTPCLEPVCMLAGTVPQPLCEHWVL